MVRSKFFQALRIALVIAAGLWSDDHILARSPRDPELLARAQPTVFHSTPGSSDVDRGETYDRGE